MRSIGFLLGVSLAAALSASAYAASTQRVSIAPGGVQANGPSSEAVISADGAFVAFVSRATNLVPGDTNGVADIFIRTLRGGPNAPVRRISVSGGGAQANGASALPSISADGRYIAFQSTANNLAAGAPDNGRSQIYVHDRVTGDTEWLAYEPEGEGDVEVWYDSPSISGDGRLVVSVRGRINAHGAVTIKILVYDRKIGSGSELLCDNNPSRDPAISLEKWFVVYSCQLDLDIGGGYTLKFSRLRPTEPAMASASGVVRPTIDSRGDALEAAPSGDGRIVAYTGSSNGRPGIYAKGINDRGVGHSLVSVSRTGSDANGVSRSPATSGNGRFIAFQSAASNLISGDSNGVHDIFVRNLAQRTTERLSVNSSGAEGNGASFAPSITADGRLVAFTSSATNLVTGDTNGFADIFVRDRGLLHGNKEDLLVDFGPSGSVGLWQYMNNARWFQIDTATPSIIALGDIDGTGRDEAIAAFPGRGLLARYNNAGAWQQLSANLPTRLAVGDFDGNARDELAAAFPPSQALSVRRDVRGFTDGPLDGPVAGLGVADLDGDAADELLIKHDGAGGGLFAWFAAENRTQRLTDPPVRFTSGDVDGNGQDDLVLERRAGAIREVVLWYNPLGPETSTVLLRSSATEGFTTGDLDGNGKDEIVADFGGVGLWALYNGEKPWIRLDTRTPKSFVTADLDGNGKDEVIADLGSTRLYVRYNNSGAFSVITSTAQTVEALAAGNFD